MTIDRVSGPLRPGASWALAGILALSVLAVGVGVVEMPFAAWALVGVLAAVAALEFSPGVWIAGAVGIAVVSRLLVYAGGPALLNFLHYPFVIGAVLSACVRRRPSRVANTLGAGVGALFVISFVSWALNGGELLRPVLTWLVFTEPFLLILAIAKAQPDRRTQTRLWWLTLALAFLQLPLGILERIFLAGNNPDLVQGSFIGQGAGAHVAGGVALVGVLMCMMRGTFEHSRMRRNLFFALAALLFLLPILSDAKQVIVAFMPAALIALASGSRVRPSKFIPPALVMGAVLFAAFHFYKPLRAVENQSTLEGLKYKMFATQVAIEDLMDRPWGLAVGVGPGNSVSRVALLTRDAHVMKRSPVAVLNLETAPLTRKLMELDSHSYLADASGSSAWSSVSSWLGLIGDLGLLGCLTYLWLMWKTWSALTARNTSISAAAKGGLLMAAALGMIFSWLEEPGFVLMVAATAGVALAARAGAPRQVAHAGLNPAREPVDYEPIPAGPDLPARRYRGWRAEQVLGGDRR